MAKITIIGDIHGYTRLYREFVESLPEGQQSIQIGDMGLGFKDTVLGTGKWTEGHKFFRGNHDSPALCKAHPSYLGDYGCTGQGGLFWCAGAFSIDRLRRVEGVTWWRDEELSMPELEKAIDLYLATKPRFVLSHEAPSNAGRVLLYNRVDPYSIAKGDCANSRTAQALEAMLIMHQPEKWIFGHYHLDAEFYVPKFDTKFIALGGVMWGGDKPHSYDLEV